jgi:predicted PurR-regulated permease PerM/methanogenic corrinoid protein MtbC1
MMKEQPKTPPLDSDDDERSGVGRAARPIIGIIIATAVLYLAKDILLPLAMATVLAVIFSPIAGRLERYLGRLLSAAVVVLAAIATLGAIVYFLTVELTSVAVEVSSYSNNIAEKLSALEKSTPSWLQHVESGIADVERQLGRPGPATQGRHPTEVRQSSSVLSDVLKPAIPVLTAVGESLLVIVLLFFLLYDRHDFRDRFVRLAARAKISIAAQAMDTAGDTVGHYLLLFSLFNLGFGIAIGLVMWLIGLPNPVFWGAIAFLLRYIPYVGAITSAILPALVAFAVFPGWGKTIEVLVSFVALDQFSAQLLEPILIGRGVGLSPAALLISAMYWAWLWGVAGLLIATPLTTCLKVAGDYIPPLGFLSILLGAESSRGGHHDYFRKLLELDHAGAQALAIRYCDQHGLEATLDDIIVPALEMMGEERGENNISEENEQFIIEATRELILELRDRSYHPQGPPRLRVLGACAPGDAHSMGLLMLLACVHQDGAAATFLGENKSAEEVRNFIRRFTPDVFCISCTMTEYLKPAVDLVRSLRNEAFDITIIAGGRAAISAPGQLLAAGCSNVFWTRGEGRRALRRFGQQRTRRPPRPTGAPQEISAREKSTAQS